jgi:hypothetical protein
LNYPTTGHNTSSNNVSAASLNAKASAMLNNNRAVPQQQLQQQANISKKKNDEWIGNMTGQGDPYAENGILGPWSAFSAGLLGNMVLSSQEKGKKVRKKPKDKPKRPLSAYNIFFKEERHRILQELPEQESKADPEAGGGRKRKKRPHGKIGFESLAKEIGRRWQDLNPEQAAYYKEKANGDMVRYKKEMEAYTSGIKTVDAEEEQDAEEEEIPGEGNEASALFEPLAKKNKLDSSVFQLGS